MKTIDVIIPVYRPGSQFDQLLEQLAAQTVRPNKIILMNTRCDAFDPTPICEKYPVELYELDAAEFDHAGTRNAGASHSEADYILFMTQDAIPADTELLENLLKSFEDPQVAVAYARQLPREDCRLIECYTRQFNYPDADCAKTLQDLPKLGIKTYFCSDVCAAYRRDIYVNMGGFEEPAIFNEDMVMAHHLIHAGFTVYYAASARVIHSHNYSCAQQFHRNFDLAVSQAQHPEIFCGVSSESEGKKMVLATAGYLLRSGHPLMIGTLVFQSAAKYLGYFMGKRYRKLSDSMIRRCTSSLLYWDRVGEKR